MKKTDFIEGLDVFPTTRTVWNDKNYEQEFAPLLRRVAGIHHKAEYLMVREGVRKCATTHLSPKSFDQMIEQITKDGLVWLPIQRTKTYGGFSHKHFPVDELSMDTSVYGVLARNIEDAEAFREASRGDKTDHDVLGELLGFPPCCTKFFNEVWMDGFYDPVWQSAERSKDAQIDGRVMKLPEVNPYTNQFMRYIGLRFTSHFPCSIECEKSIEIGKEWERISAMVDEYGTQKLKELLSLSFKWSVNHGIAVVETKPFTIVANSMPTKERWEVNVG